MAVAVMAFYAQVRPVDAAAVKSNRNTVTHIKTHLICYNTTTERAIGFPLRLSADWSALWELCHDSSFCWSCCCCRCCCCCLNEYSQRCFAIFAALPVAYLSPLKATVTPNCSVPHLLGCPSARSLAHLSDPILSIANFLKRDAGRRAKARLHYELCCLPYKQAQYG